MRSISEIKKEMTDAFMADPIIIAKYDPTSSWTITTQFEDVFASSSIESILFYIVAVISYGLEFMFNAHIDQVAAMETKMRVGSREWWRQLAFNFQFGFSLQFNSSINVFEYTYVDESAKIIKYVDCRETSIGLVMLIAKADSDGNPVKLAVGSAERAAFAAYIKKSKIAGVPLNWQSYDADLVRMYLTVVVDPLVIDASGMDIQNSNYPVEDAIGAYLKAIPFGSGRMNKTQIIDAIQAAPGIVDVYPSISDWLEVSTEYVPAFTAIGTQNVNAYGGSFKIDTLDIIYLSNV